MYSLIPQLVATLGATFGAFALGNVIAWPSSVLEKINLSDSTESWIVSIFMIGAALVPWVASAAFQFIGKKWTLIVVAVPFIGGWVLLTFAKENAAMLLIGRFITGFCGGMFVLAAPAYSSEIAETKYRGALGTLMQLMVCLGIFFINVNCSTDWRVLTGICIAFPTLMAVWMFFMPRSPVYLLSKGDKEAAKKSLQFFRGTKEVDEELKEIESSVQERSSVGSVSVKALFTDKRYSKPLGIVLVLMALQQLSGINYILSYSVLIFKKAGTSIDECTSAMLIGAVQVIGTFVTTLIIEKFGRKILLIISDLFICISMIGVAVFFLLYEQCGDECSGDAESPNNITTTMMMTTTTTTILPESFVSKDTVDSIGFLPLVSLMLFITAFSIGFGPIPWILNVELIPPEARALSSSLATSFNWIVSFLVAQFIPVIGEAIGDSACYFIFSAIALLGTVFITIFVPETKGKSEDEIKAILSK